MYWRYLCQCHTNRYGSTKRIKYLDTIAHKKILLTFQERPIVFFFLFCLNLTCVMNEEILFFSSWKKNIIVRMSTLFSLCVTYMQLSVWLLSYSLIIMISQFWQPLIPNMYSHSSNCTDSICSKMRISVLNELSDSE